MTEFEMVQIVAKNIVEEGKRVATEVAFMSQSIDMVFEDDNKLIAVEFKKSDWKRAIKQAKTHRLGADRVYICIPKPKRRISQELILMLNKYGIGLFLFDATCKQIQEIVTPFLTYDSFKFPKEWLKESFDMRCAKEDFESVY